MEVTLRGGWTDLAPVEDCDPAELAQLDQGRELLAQMGGGVERAASRLPSMTIRRREDQVLIGVIENRPVPSFPGVVAVTLYVDRGLARAALSLDAFIAYMEFLFVNEVRFVHLEVFEFNRMMLNMIRKWGLHPAVRLRGHGYAAGRFWDLLIFAVDRPTWDRVMARHARFLGGAKRLTALGGGPRGSAGSGGVDG